MISESRDLGGPEIIIRSPTVSDSSKKTSTPKVNLSGTAMVRLREKSPVSNILKQSWRQTPVISPDVVDMILKGEIFDADGEYDNDGNKKLDTCIEEDESAKTFSPTESRTESRVGRHTPILKTSKSNSPDQTPVKVSIKSEPIVSEDCLPVYRPRRKFLSADERSCTVDAIPSPGSTLSPDEDRVSSAPDPDLLSASMDMRGVNMQDNFSRLRTPSLSHSRSTPDLTEITSQAVKGAKAKRSNSKRRFGRVRVDTYVNSSSSSPQSSTDPTSPRHMSGSASFSPKHSASSLSSRFLAGTRINQALSSFSRRSEKGKSEKEKISESRSRGSRTLK